MTELGAFVGGLVAILGLTFLTAWRIPNERKQLMRCGLAILANWTAGAAYVYLSGNLTPWHFSIFIDTAAAIAVTRHPAGRVQGFIGLFYFLQIAFHTVFGFRTWLGYYTDPQAYYDRITWIAWAQLAAMGVWCGGIWSVAFLHHRRDRLDAVDSRARLANSRKAP